MQSKKEIIAELRSQGRSLPEICEITGFAKSTVFYHLDDRIRNSRKVKESAARASAVAQKNAEERRLALIEQARKEWSNISKDPRTMGFLGLYWGEGRKAPSRNGIAAVSISNNDPKFIEFCYQFLIEHTSKQITAIIRTYPSHDADKCEEYWQALLPKAEIRIRPNKDKRSKSKHNGRCPFGHCDLRFSDMELFIKISTWIECWKHTPLTQW